jgi:protoheme ferro-lyase
MTREIMIVGMGFFIDQLEILKDIIRTPAKVEF